MRVVIGCSGFDRCLAMAAEVEFSSTSEYLDDPVLFDFCSRIAMGAAVVRSRFLETDAFQVAVWDGITSGGIAGTAVDVAAWRASGRESVIIDVAPDEDDEPTTHRRRENPRSIRPIVFADFAGFSSLTDAQVITFQEKIMGGVADVIEPFSEHLLSGRTWGDGLNLVFDDVVFAAHCALALQEAAKGLDFEAMGLDTIRGVRIAAHAAPVFDGTDPVSGRRLFYGARLHAGRPDRASHARRGDLPRPDRLRPWRCWPVEISSIASTSARCQPPRATASCRCSPSGAADPVRGLLALPAMLRESEKWRPHLRSTTWCQAILVSARRDETSFYRVGSGRDWE